MSMHFNWHKYSICPEQLVNSNYFEQKLRLELQINDVCYRSLVPEYSDIMDKTQPIQGSQQQMCVCVYVCMCVYVFKIEMRGWEDLCRLSQQTSGYMLLYHTPVCTHISRVPVGLIASFVTSYHAQVFLLL